MHTLNRLSLTWWLITMVHGSLYYMHVCTESIEKATYFGTVYNETFVIEISPAFRTKIAQWSIYWLWELLHVSCTRTHKTGWHCNKSRCQAPWFANANSVQNHQRKHLLNSNKPIFCLSANICIITIQIIKEGKQCWTEAVHTELDGICMQSKTFHNIFDILV